MLFYCCVASGANEQQTILNQKKKIHYSFICWYPVLNEIIISLWTLRRWMNLQPTVFALSGIQRMMCVVGIFPSFAMRSSSCYRTLGWVYHVKFYFFSPVEVFIKVTIVLALFLEEDNVLLWVFKLCYTRTTRTTETIDGIVIDGNVMYLIPWSQRLFSIFPRVREPRIVECESRTGEKE